MAARTTLNSISKPKAKKHRRFQPFVLWLVPILGLLMIFSVFPILASFYLSLFDFEMLQPLKFVGLNNFIYAFTRDFVFHKTVVNTIYFALVSVPLGMAVSLIVAQLIFGRKHLQSLWRTIYFLPVVTPVVAIAIVWRFIYQPSKFGFLNSLMATVGINPISWINSQDWVIPSLIFLSIWASLGYNMVLFLAGLGGIPYTFYEAAKIDGANEWQMFWGITAPLLSPTVLFTTITGTISAMQIFSIPYIMTRGGPENASRMWVMWIQEVGFSQFRMGYASSLSVLFFLFIMALTFIQLRLLRTQWSY
jgi:multiple sugar transport system permease protein